MAQNVGRRIQDTIEKIKASNVREDLMFLLPFDSSVDGTVFDPEPATFQCVK